jgi:hypothetical protein
MPPALSDGHEARFPQTKGPVDDDAARPLPGLLKHLLQERELSFALGKLHLL